MGGGGWCWPAPSRPGAALLLPKRREPAGGRRLAEGMGEGAPSIGSRFRTFRARSSEAVALLFAVVGVVVVAVPLPEAGLVVVEELEPAQPLCRLPEVLPRDDEPKGPAVIR